jgi:hypothetical protein
MADILHLKTTVDALLYSTVRVEATLPGGKISTGTGFVIRYTPDPGNPDKYFPALITNKHVVRDAISGRLYFHQGHTTADGSFQPTRQMAVLEIADFPQAWIMHPVHSDVDDEVSDPAKSVDLCAAPLGRALKELHAQGITLYPMQVAESMVPSRDALLDREIVETVMMVGYPDGLWDDQHGFPLFRRGSTASHPAVDFSGWPVGALDIAAYRGSSGSPVILIEEGADYSLSNTPPRAPLLLGVLFSGPQVDAEGRLELDGIPTQDLPPTTTKVFMNLGFYVKARELLVLRDEIFRQMGIGFTPAATD